MRLKEQRLWDSLRANMQGYKILLQRLENGLEAGWPDVISNCRWKAVWLELKAVDGWPARERTRVLGDEGLSIEQENWALAWTQSEGHCYILIGVGRGHDRELFLVPGALAAEVNQFNKKQLMKFSTTWKDIAQVLAP